VNVDDFIALMSKECQLYVIHQKVVEACRDRDRITSGTVGLQRVFHKANLGHSGLSCPDDFKRAMQTFGAGLTDHEIDVLYHTTTEATQLNGIRIADFISSLRNDVAKNEAANMVDHLSNKLRGILTHHRGCNGMIELQRCIARQNNTSPLDAVDFVTAVRNVGIGGVLADVELEAIFNHHSSSAGTVSPETILSAIRGEVNSGKMDAIMQAWHVLDLEHLSWCTLQTLLSHMKVGQMPDVLDRRKTEREVQNELLEYFETRDGTVSRTTFVDYWCNVSVSIPDSNQFSLILWNIFDLSKQSRQPKSRVDSTSVRNNTHDAPPPPKKPVERDGGYTAPAAAAAAPVTPVKNSPTPSLFPQHNTRDGTLAPSPRTANDAHHEFFEISSSTHHAPQPLLYAISPTGSSPSDSGQTHMMSSLAMDQQSIASSNLSSATSATQQRAKGRAFCEASRLELFKERPF
jgi:Ca2+-binding EF-hand superfamily protein